MFLLFVSSLFLGFLGYSSAAVLPRQGAVTPLTAAQISAFKPYTLFASAAYCDPSTTKNWSCGANCKGNPDFIPVASGGDGVITQFWFVGFDPTLNTVVVGHQGTDSSAIIPLITDADFFLTSLDQTMFPGTEGLEVHSGFKATHARAAPDVLAAVNKALAAHPTTKVTIVGHSLGAAISLLDAVFLPLHLPSSTTFKFVGYGMPRVGNHEFAQYLDSHFPDLTHINNQEDIVPILPGEWHPIVQTRGEACLLNMLGNEGRFLGFHHPQGEVHIDDSGVWESCAGDDNTSKLCTTGDVSNIFKGKSGNHAGPYDGVRMSCG